MSRWEVGVKSGQNYTNVLEVEGVSHVDSIGRDGRTDFSDHPIETVFFSKKKGKDPVSELVLHKTLLTVPYSELVYYKRLPKKGKKNG